jgi:predicted AlkP superfamily pyrophosphatase or phosphodiesterase
MKKGFLLLFAFVFTVKFLNAQKNIYPATPKLVVGIVIDQMRYDFLWRFWDIYGEGGFKRLVNEGFLCRNARYNYFLTTTAPGHSTIYTGTSPAIHGIVDNNWYDRQKSRMIYCASDSVTKTVGNLLTSGGSSPHNLLSSTITDELKLAFKESRVIGLALKDRSAIMPAGHLSDGSFWYDSKTGNWITSTWYMETLPTWLDGFNKSSKKDSYTAADWTLLLPRNKYMECTNDTVPYENTFPGEPLPVFPHKISKGNFFLLPNTPFANTMTKDIAIEALREEQLGKREAIDFLCISFSSTDLIGHAFGPNSLETADCYARLDRDLSSLLQFLDSAIGKENILVFLTADHGVAINAALANDQQLNGGFFQADSLRNKLNMFLSSSFGQGEWVSAMSDQQVYLNQEYIASSKIAGEDVAEKVSEFLLMQKGVLCTVAPKYHLNTCAPIISNTLMNGYYPARSGDVIYSLAPGWIDWSSTKGSSHGTLYDYDTHVPLIWYGWKIDHGSSAEPVDIPDIAPTIADWLRIPYPSGCSGKPITDIRLK